LEVIEVEEVREVRIKNHKRNFTNHHSPLTKRFNDSTIKQFNNSTKL